MFVERLYQVYASHRQVMNFTDRLDKYRSRREESAEKLAR